VEFIFKKAGKKLVVLGQSEQDTTKELADDLLAICNYFVAKNNGLRSAENRRKCKAKIKEAKNNKNKHQRKQETQKSQDSSWEDKEDQIIAESGTEEYIA